MSWLRANWFAVGAVVFAAGSYVAALRTVQAQVNDVETSIKSEAAEHAKLEPRVTVVEKEQAATREDIKAIRAATERSALNVAALCERVQARCER